MMRRAVPILFLLAATACTPTGFGNGGGGGGPNPLPGVPPPAQISGPSGTVRMAYGSYCWTTRCVDKASPELRRDIPQVGLGGGQATIQLGFAPTRGVVVRLGSQVLVRSHRRSVRVDVPRDGLLEVDAGDRRGSVSYVVRVLVPVVD
jgi:hypothetical protein